MRNFLPEYRPPETSGRLQCQVRGHDVPATPEEKVRQRVLHWLINTKEWPRGRLRVEQSYAWESDANRSHIRSDVELLNKDESVLVVVEVKRENVPPTKAVEDQAIEYAIKSGAPYIWITNGKEHRFLQCTRKGKWLAVSSIEPLGEEYEPPTGKVAFPDPLVDTEVDSYLKEMLDIAPDDKNVSTKQRDFTLALYKAIFDELDGKRRKRRLPYSHDGVHLLEYLGVAYHEFSNASGGGFDSRYADFIAATRGRVEAMSVAVNTWYPKGIRLCIGVSKAQRKHHSLQLNYKGNCVWIDNRQCWEVWHDGAMARISPSVVLDAVREAGCGHWIYTDEDHNEWVYLGELPEVGRVTWKNTRKFLANLLHYGIIRTNLREARKVRKT